jgi:hypothetical protein
MGRGVPGSHTMIQRLNRGHPAETRKPRAAHAGSAPRFQVGFAILGVLGNEFSEFNEAQSLDPKRTTFARMLHILGRRAVSLGSWSAADHQVQSLALASTVFSL